LRVLVGEAFGAVSPVAVRSPTLFVDIALGAGDAFPLPPAVERAVYVIEGGAQLDGEDIPPGRMVVLAQGDEPLLSADAEARVVLVGGTPLGHRHIWWNFVSSRQERIAKAADDWAAQRLGTVAGETEFIPLPDKRPG
jgi:redox-sensitive bicupin YhaK (pirin superfamily)